MLLAIHLLRDTWIGKYVTLSAVGLLINLGLTIGLHEVCGLAEEASFLLALVVIFFGNFVGLRFYVSPDPA